MLQEFYHCRKEERVLNNCVFEKLVRFLPLFLPSGVVIKDTPPMRGVFTRRKLTTDFRPLIAREQKLKKDIPGSPEGQPQIHEKSWTVYGAIQK